MTRKLLGRASGVAGACIVMTIIAQVVTASTVDSRQRDAIDVRSYGPGPIDIQAEGPLMEGRLTTLTEAIEVTGYPSFPVPPTTPLTGSLTGIWIDGLKQVAFVWSTNLRFYVNPLLDVRQEELAAGWAATAPLMKKAALTRVGGTFGLGIDGSGDQEPSSLTWADPENGLLLQFVSPAHSVTQLKEFVAGFEYRVS